MKNIAVIGAGVSGMAAAVYCLKSGLNVTVYEQHSSSGGLCTSWKRNGYTFEGAVHWLTNSSPKAPLYRLWRGTDILADDVKVFRDDPYLALKINGEEIYLCRDLEKQKKHFLELSPQDAKVIDALYHDVKAFINLQIPVMDIKGLRVKNKSKMPAFAKMIPILFKIGRLSKMTAAEYAAQFKHEGIKTILRDFVTRADYDSISLITTIATFINDGVFPEGGALALAKRMENKINALGGKILFNTKVDKIIVENNKAKGVIINEKKEVKAKVYDSIIITVDTISALNLFDNPPRDKWIEDLKTKKPVISTFAGIGVHADLSNLPRTIFIDEKINAGRITNDFWLLRNYSNHRLYAPQGCTALTALFRGADYNFWNEHKQNGTYNEQKELIAAEIKRILENHIPEIKDKIDVINIATPLTYERYTSSHHGAWMTIREKGTKFVIPKPTCAGIKNICFAGFRTIIPGGLPVALYSGFRAAQYTCRDNNITFEG